MKYEQLEMEFYQFFKAEEMGRVFGHTIYLSEKFIREVLKEKGIWKEGLEFLDEKKKIRSVHCPFCKKGLLKLVKVEPIYQGGIAKIPQTKQHVGCHYEYVCTNPKCDGVFKGKYQWAYID